MYNRGIVLSVQDRYGNTLSEKNGLVHVPFGTEYQLYIKNETHQRACVEVIIDGQNPFGDSEFVVNAFDKLVLKGDEKNYSFKFLEKTGKMKERRKNKIHDSTVKIEYSFEKPKMLLIDNKDWTTWKTQPNWFVDPNMYSTFNTEEYLCNVNVTHTSTNSVKEITRGVDLSGKGVTGRGNEVDQTFTTTSLGELESTTHSITLTLTGVFEDLNSPVKKVVKSRQRMTCSLCGTRQTVNNNFCGHCGTNLKAQLAG